MDSLFNTKKNTLTAQFRSNFFMNDLMIPSLLSSSG